MISWIGLASYSCAEWISLDMVMMNGNYTTKFQRLGIVGWYHRVLYPGNYPIRFVDLVSLSHDNCNICHRNLRQLIGCQALSNLLVVANITVIFFLCLNDTIFGQHSCCWWCFVACWSWWAVVCIVNIAITIIASELFLVVLVFIHTFDIGIVILLVNVSRNPKLFGSLMKQHECLT